MKSSEKNQYKKEDNDECPLIEKKISLDENNLSSRRKIVLKDNYGMLVTALIIAVPSITYMIATTFLNILIAKIFCLIESILFIVNIISFIDITTSNPGYQISKQITEEEYNEKAPSVKIKDTIFVLKYCKTCKIVRNVRTFHCKFCGKCVKMHDHHCGFISNCIGKNNFKKFNIFLLITLNHSGFIVITTYYFISFPEALKKIFMKDPNVEVIIFMVLIFVSFFLFFVLLLAIQNCCFISKGITKNEFIRNQYNAAYFFDKGCIANWKEFCCNDKNISDGEEEEELIV